jgi:hypothetical protein
MALVGVSWGVLPIDLPRFWRRCAAAPQEMDRIRADRPGRAGMGISRHATAGGRRPGRGRRPGNDVQVRRRCCAGRLDRGQESHSFASSARIVSPITVGMGPDLAGVDVFDDTQRAGFVNGIFRRHPVAARSPVKGQLSLTNPAIVGRPVKAITRAPHAHCPHVGDPRGQNRGNCGEGGAGLH